MEKVVSLAQEPAAADNTVVLVQAMAHLPGWDEKNFQVTGPSCLQQDPTLHASLL